MDVSISMTCLLLIEDFIDSKSTSPIWKLMMLSGSNDATYALPHHHEYIFRHIGALQLAPLHPARVHQLVPNFFILDELKHGATNRCSRECQDKMHDLVR
jgi:hypothetical protein